MSTADFELSPELREAITAHVASEKPRKAQVEDQIALILLALSRIQSRSQRWAEEIEQGKQVFDWESSRQFSDLYQWWLTSSEPVVSKISFYKSTFGHIEKADELEQAFRDVSLMSLDTKRVRGSIESLDKGRGIPFERAMDELRNNLR